MICQIGSDERVRLRAFARATADPRSNWKDDDWTSLRGILLSRENQLQVNYIFRLRSRDMMRKPVVAWTDYGRHTPVLGKGLLWTFLRFATA